MSSFSLKRVLTGAVGFGTLSVGVPVARAVVAFTPGDVVVYQVGDGTATLASTGNSVFLDEFSPAGTPVQSVALPNSGSNALIASGTATSEGFITLSPNGEYLTLTGYNQAANTSGSIASGSAPRIVDVVGSSGAVLSSTALTDFAVGNNPRSAITTDGNSLYVAGAAGGLRYTTVGSTTSTQLSTTSTNLRTAEIFGGQLYTSSGSGAIRIATVGTGLPTTAGQTITNLSGISNASSASPYAFVLEQLNPLSTGPDTLYVADDTANAIEKFSLVGGTFTETGSVAISGVRGLTAETLPGGSIELFATAAPTTTSSTLYSLTDATGFDGTLAGTATTLATAGTNEAFRGVAFVPTNTPVPEPASIAILGLTAIATLGRRRRTA